MNKKRHAFVGTGSRARSFLEPLVTQYQDRNELVALCDTSQVRLDYYNRTLTERLHHPAVPTFKAAEFGEMLRSTRPDEVFVCTVDGFHHEYIIAALQAGCDVITEKPMTTSAEKCNAILAAVRQTGKRLRVAFNYRWSPYRTKVRELISSGVIGKVHSVNLEYLLDTQHGADYFRRWHAQIENSGSLLVHKSTHHFDLVNWWLNAIPAQVFAYGDLVYYGKENALARGDAHLTQYPRYTSEPLAKDDPFRLDLTESESFEQLYLNAERESGYLRDQNVFRDGITIPDQMSLNVRYRTGQVLNYSLIAYSPREGMRVAFNGDRGRLEYYEFVGSHLNRAVAPSEWRIEEHASAEADGEWIRVFPHFAKSFTAPVQEVPGAHGGADRILNAHFYDAQQEADAWRRTAGHEQGAASIGIGIAALASIKTGMPVNVSDLIDLPKQAQRLDELA